MELNWIWLINRSGCYLALLEAGLSEGAFGAGTVAVASLPAAGAGALAADRIALGFVETRATVPAVGPPFVLRASCKQI